MKVQKARWVPYGLILVFVLTGLVGFFRPGDSPLAPVVVFSEPYEVPSPISLFARWIPTTPGWAWFWHLKEAVCGKIKPVNLDTDILTVSKTFTPTFGSPTFDGAGSLDATRLRVWLLDAADLKSFRQQLKGASGVVLVNSPRMTTGDGIGASMFVGETIVLNGATNETGVRVTYLSRVRQNLIDLTASIEVVEPVTNEPLAVALQTNLNVKARFQIPKGKGVFLLQSFPNQTNQSAMGVIVSAKL
jgi:hypothetical protein